MLRHAFKMTIMSLAFFAIATGSANAQNLKFATVDVQQLLVDSKAGKSLQKQILTQRDSIQKEMSELDKSLQSKQAALVSERGKLSDEELSKKQVNFEKEVLDARNKMQLRGTNLDKNANAALNSLRDKITDVVYKMATEKNIDLVLTRQNVVAASKTVDITADVLKVLDTQMPDIKLDQASNAAAAPTAAPEKGKKG
jgi:Skp family chaperone for outer membrane proteins